MSAPLSIEDLTLVGTDEPFYLDEGETFESAHLHANGTVLVRLLTPEGRYFVLAGLSTASRP